MRIAVISGVVLLHVAVLLHRSSLVPVEAPRATESPPRMAVSVMLERLAEPTRPLPPKVASPLKPPAGPAAAPVEARAQDEGSAAEAHEEGSRTVDAPAAAPLNSASPPAAHTDTSPDYSRNPLPPYPPASRRAQEQGRVVVSVLVGIDGTVKEAIVKKSSGYIRLDAAALDAVRQWTFTPGTRSGEKAAMWVSVPVNFELSI